MELHVNLDKQGISGKMEQSSKEWIMECYDKKKLVDIEPYLMQAGKPWRKGSICHETTQGGNAKLYANGGTYCSITKSVFSLKGRKWVSKTLGSLCFPSTNVLERFNGRSRLYSIGLYSALECQSKSRAVQENMCRYLKSGFCF